MDKKRPLDNGPLTAMIFCGTAAFVVGAVIWLANTDFDYDPNSYGGGFDDSSPAGQFAGTSIGLAGLLLLALGWAAAAICRQIADAAQRPEA
ncbi:hypothetical protein AB0K52_03185 [Glycomyces sp. NPDC049804]|uniref:hypothetical protein n=1 Tax=Glycomyces sp. NPDC049804 TaxID=3154363 RepID=UPI003443BF7B